MKIALTMAFVLLTLSACANTWNGVGRDVERVGERMQPG